MRRRGICRTRRGPGRTATARSRRTATACSARCKNIRIGDELRVRTPHGELRYKVTTTKIVKPTDLSVLAPTKGQTLTLITCYPFYFVGSAPKRFIVHAERVDAYEAARRDRLRRQHRIEAQAPPELPPQQIEIQHHMHQD